MDAEHETAPTLPKQPQMSAAEYARSRHSVWLSSAALVTDPLGRVLLVKPSHREQWLLPGQRPPGADPPGGRAGRRGRHRHGGAHRRRPDHRALRGAQPREAVAHAGRERPAALKPVSEADRAGSPTNGLGTRSAGSSSAPKLTQPEPPQLVHRSWPFLRSRRSDETHIEPTPTATRYG